MYFFLGYNGIVIHQLIKNVDKLLMTPFALILSHVSHSSRQYKPTP